MSATASVEIGSGAPRPQVRAAHRPGVWTAHLLSVLVVIAWGAAAAVLPSYLLPGPIVVATSAIELLSSANFLLNALLSLWHIMASIAIAFTGGLVLALAMHFAPVLRLAINGRLNPFLSSFSTIGWVFLAIFWFGLTDFTVIFVVAVTLLPFALSNVRAGLDSLDGEMIELAKSFGRRRRRLLRMMLLPLLVPYLFATLRICLGVAWKVVLTAELFGGSSGLGYQISRARADLDIPAIFAIILIIVAIVTITDKLLLEPVQLHLRRNYAVS
jgi:NitT/TauT family transport system permease protein